MGAITLIKYGMLLCFLLIDAYFHSKGKVIVFRALSAISKQLCPLNYRIRIVG